MGSCLSKKKNNPKTPDLILGQTELVSVVPVVEKKKVNEEVLKKEIFVIKHRKSSELERRKERDCVEGLRNGGQVRSGSCSKEEVDAILIQCGRLSRSSSAGRGGGSCEDVEGGCSKGRVYCGSKRSFDFDNENGEGMGRGRGGGEGEEEEEGSVDRRRYRSRTPSGSGGRRRTPSREREQGMQQARSGSRERGVNGSGRRVSRSPGRRSESPNTSSNGNGGGGSNCSKPQKMVSVPATVSSLAMDRSSNGNGGEGVSAASIMRIEVRRNVGGGGDVAAGGGTRTAASPRAWSPARNVQNRQPLSLSRSNSRKNEQSPFRRNPLSEIDTNVVLEKMPVPGFKTSSNNVMSQASAQELNGLSEAKQSTNVNVVNVVMSESLKPQGRVRSRSSRLSRDLDINTEALMNANPSYTSLLLEDIHNFHHKNTGPVPAVDDIHKFHQTNSGPIPAVTLPACVTKAHSILEALADLNSSSGSTLSSAFSENRRRSPLEDNNHSQGVNPTELRKLETKKSFVKSRVVVGLADANLMQPSFDKYVTVRRGTLEGRELEEQESSGSNSLVGGSQQHWVSSSSWEPTSSDSTDRWTPKSEDEFNPLGFRRQSVSDKGGELDDTRRVVIQRKDGNLQQNGIGRGRVGPRGEYTTAAPATASG